MTIAEFDQSNNEEKKAALSKCCGSSAWVNQMLTEFPMEDLVELLEAAEEKWYQCSEADWLEAFTHHPKIGDVDSLKNKFASTADWAADEQSSISQTSNEILEALVKGNELYLDKFGYIFIVFATGKTAAEMLHLLEERLTNEPAVELKIAMEEQNKITKLRLEKLFIS